MLTLQSELHRELINRILPYWMQKMPDNEHGGFYGRIDGEERVHPYATKGIVLNARILWTFSAAYRLEKKLEYLKMAERAYEYIQACFVDKAYGGVFWELDYKGEPLNRRKQIYAQGFAIYGFSEFFRATGKQEALEAAIAIFRLLERHAYDSQWGGYVEALDERWQIIEDMRLSSRDENAPKSMNTHLHILEPYTNLLRVWKDPALIEAQTRLISIFCEHIVNSQTGHLHLFFDWDWKTSNDDVSFGHDIEASWLLYEAAKVLGNPGLMDKIKERSVQIIEASCEGLQPDGSLIYEQKHNEPADTDRHWWVQAETVVGSYHAGLRTGDHKYVEVAEKCWEYIKQYLIDNTNGEWVWSAHADGTQNHADDKAGFWKCPYHNSRMCLEIIHNS